ncbi:MAG TPA: exonuclease domain-containing protein [Candidatus Paceibacterota bacterium]
MKDLIIFDTETTGNTSSDFLCQLAYKAVGEQEITIIYAKPPKAIPFEAMATHHITEKRVANEPAFQENPQYADVKALFENPNTIAIAHNAPFDVAILKNDKINVATMLDTCKVAAHTKKYHNAERNGLQYLRYFFDIDIPLSEALPHSAEGDVLVLEKIFIKLRDIIMQHENKSEEEALAEMLRLSTAPLMIETITFGKYKGRKVLDIAVEDKRYLQWLYDEKLKNTEQDETDWLRTLERALGIPTPPTNLFEDAFIQYE